LLPLILSCGGAQEVPADIAATEQTSAELGLGDVFEVRVFGQENLSAQYRIEPDGTIDYPFLGRVEVAGKSPRQISQLIADGLRDGEILVSPDVTIYVVEATSRRVSVTGAVANPGTFAVFPGMTVVQAISQAGGFSALASQDNTVLTRTTAEGRRRFRVPVSRITDGRARDVRVMGGDIIFVPARVF